MAQIREMIGADHNFNNYLNLLHSINPPCIPILEVQLQELIHIGKSNPACLPGSIKIINFAKYVKIAQVIMEIQKHQSVPYVLWPVEDLQQFIESQLQSTEDEEQLYKESLELESR